MKKFLLLITTLIFLCGGAAALSACSGDKTGDEGGQEGGDEITWTPAKGFEVYSSDIEYRFSITSDVDSPNGEINDGALRSDMQLEQGNTYYLVLDCAFHGFGWTGDNFTLSTRICDTNSLVATLHEAYTYDFTEHTEDYEYVFSTRYAVPQQGGDIVRYRVIYEINMIHGIVFTAWLDVDGQGKSTPFAVGSGLGMKLNEQKTAYTVTNLVSYAVTDLSIPEYFGGYPVTAIDEMAFANKTALQSLDLPANLTYIGYGAFGNCSSLADIEIPQGVTYIGEYAFSGCSSIENIVIPGGVTSIGQYTFANCESLSAVRFSESKTTVQIGDKAFCKCKNLTDIQFNWISTIGNSAFEGCTSLTKITIPESVTSIGNSAFYGCSNLANITLPASVTSIGSDAFYECESFTNVVIPGGVKTIGGSAFGGCTSLASITLPFVGNGSDKSDFGYIFEASRYSSGSYIVPSSLKTVIITGGDKIGDNAFYGCTKLTKIQLPESVTSVGLKAFYNCTALEDINMPKSVTSIGNNAFEYCSALKGVEIPAGLTAIKQCVFKSCSSLSSIVIPESIISIEYGAFSGCTKLENLTIPENVTSVGENAFYNCSKLIKTTDGARYVDKWVVGFDSYNKSALDLSAGTKGIAGGAFSDFSYLSSISMPDSVISIGDSAFYKCGRLENITLPKNVIYIGNSAFYNCTSLTSLNIPDSVTSIGGNAFYGCAAEIKWGENPSVTAIADSAFSGYKGKSLSIPEGVTSVGAKVFANCSALESITVPLSVASFGEKAFAGCTNLKQVNITDLKAWCNIIFADASANPLSLGGNFYSDGEIMTTLEIPQGVTAIKDYAFAGFGGTGVTIPEGVKSIGNGAFYKCAHLSVITIPGSVTSIGKEAFFNCTALGEVVFGSTANWKVAVGEDMSNAQDAAVSSNSMQNAKLLTMDYSSCFWRRYDN